MLDYILNKLFGRDDYEVHFRVLDEDGETMIDTEDPEVFAAFIKDLKDEEAKKSTCNQDCACCDACDDACDDWEDDCGDEEDWDIDDDDFDDDYDEEIVYEIPVLGVFAAAALVGSVAALIKALKKR